MRRREQTGGEAEETHICRPRQGNMGHRDVGRERELIEERPRRQADRQAVSQPARQAYRHRQAAKQAGMTGPWTGATSHMDQHVLEHCCITGLPITLLHYSCVTSGAPLRGGGGETSGGREAVIS